MSVSHSHFGLEGSFAFDKLLLEFIPVVGQIVFKIRLPFKLLQDHDLPLEMGFFFFY